MRSLRFLLAVPMLLVIGSPALAVKPFYDEFKKDYLVNHKDKKFAETVEKEDKCLICHQGRQKKARNAFGQEISKLLTKKDAKNTAKMDEAFKKVLAMHVDPKNDKSETYLERLNKGEWPGGKLEDLKKEAKKDGKEEKKE